MLIPIPILVRVYSVLVLCCDSVYLWCVRVGVCAYNKCISAIKDWFIASLWAPWTSSSAGASSAIGERCPDAFPPGVPAPASLAASDVAGRKAAPFCARKTIFRLWAQSDRFSAAPRPPLRTSFGAPRAVGGRGRDVLGAGVGGIFTTPVPVHLRCVYLFFFLGQSNQSTLSKSVNVCVGGPNSTVK